MSTEAFGTKIDRELKDHEIIMIIAEKRRFIHPTQTSGQIAIDWDFRRKRAEHGEEESNG
jgi:hypothetical protein